MGLMHCDELGRPQVCFRGACSHLSILLSCYLFNSLWRFILRFFSQAFVREVWVFFHPARLFPAIVVGRRFKGCVSWVEKNRVCRSKRHLFFLRLLYLRPLQGRYSCDLLFTGACKRDYGRACVVLVRPYRARHWFSRFGANVYLFVARLLLIFVPILYVSGVLHLLGSQFRLLGYKFFLGFPGV